MARLSPENVERARSLVGRYPQSRSALLPLVHLAQQQDGQVTDEALGHIAELLGLTGAEVLGTVSFYTMFKREAVGRHLVSICTNIACLLDGGYELLDYAGGALGVGVGETTPDGEFTLEEVECLALCDQAPCLQVNYRFFGNVTPEGFDQLTADAAAGRLEHDVPRHGVIIRDAPSTTSWHNPGDGGARRGRPGAIPGSGAGSSAGGSAARGSGEGEAAEARGGPVGDPEQAGGDRETGRRTEDKG